MSDFIYALRMSYTDNRSLQSPHSFLVSYPVSGEAHNYDERQKVAGSLKSIAPEIIWDLKSNRPFRKIQRNLRTRMGKHGFKVLGEMYVESEALAEKAKDKVDIWVPSWYNWQGFRGPGISSNKISPIIGGRLKKEHNGVPGRPYRVWFMGNEIAIDKITTGYRDKRPEPVDDDSGHGIISWWLRG